MKADFFARTKYISLPNNGVLLQQKVAAKVSGQWQQTNRRDRDKALALNCLFSHAVPP